MTTLHELYAETPTVRAVAERLGITPAAARKRLLRAGVIKSRRMAYTPEEIKRGTTLRDEGMPATWIAEDLGKDLRELRRVLPPDPEASKEWKRVWSGIFPNPTLLALHEEFKPRVQRDVYSHGYVESTRNEPGDDAVGADAA